MKLWKCGSCHNEFHLSDQLAPEIKAFLYSGICPECGARALEEFPKNEPTQEDEWEDVPDGEA